MLHSIDALKRAFSDGVIAYYEMNDGDSVPTVELDGSQVRLRDVCQKLWNCSDIMPNSLIQHLRDLDEHFEKPLVTFAQGARFLRERIEADENVAFV